jgi:Domain of unknown function (DUF4403)
VKRSLYLLPVLSLSLFFNSCKTLQIDKPKETYLPSNIAPALSELPLTVELDVKKLEASVNRKLVGTLFEGSNIGGQDLTVKVIKVQNFTFSVKNNVVEYKVPLKVWTKFAWKVEKFGVTVGDTYEVNGAIALTFKTVISIDKNWKLVAKTASSGYEWIETPKVSVMGVTVPLKPIADLALSKSDKLIAEQIDKTLAEGVDTKKYANQAWNQIQKPIQVNAEHNVWVRITPQDVLMFPLTSVGNKLNIALALNGQVESFVGAKPNENALVPLPPFKTVNRVPEHFNLNLGADVTFDQISDLAKKELVNKTFTEGKKSITVTDLSVFGSAGKPIFALDVKGSLKGRIYFTGNIVYNAEKMVVQITEPEFEINTSNALVKSASWLLHGTILKSLSPYLTYSLKDNLEKMKTDVNQMMSNFSITDGVALQGKINDIKVLNLSLVPGALRISANLKGSVALKVDNLNL